MRLRILCPLRTVLDRSDILSITARDESGSFGIRQGHAPFLTALPPSVLTLVAGRGETHYAAVAGGMLRVDAGGVLITSPDAAIGDQLAPLAARVAAETAAQRHRQAEGQAQERKLQAALVHHLLDSVTGERKGDGGVP